MRIRRVRVLARLERGFEQSIGHERVLSIRMAVYRSASASFSYSDGMSRWKRSSSEVKERRAVFTSGVGRSGPARNRLPPATRKGSTRQPRAMERGSARATPGGTSLGFRCVSERPCCRLNASYRLSSVREPRRTKYSPSRSPGGHRASAFLTSEALRYPEPARISPSLRLCGSNAARDGYEWSVLSQGSGWRRARANAYRPAACSTAPALSAFANTARIGTPRENQTP